MFKGKRIRIRDSGIVRTAFAKSSGRVEQELFSGRNTRFIMNRP